MNSQENGEAVIERALLDAHPNADPLWFTGANSDDSPLAGGLAIRIDEPVPHWLVVSRGFTELDDEDSDDPDVSGFGFELSCRVPAHGEEHDFGWVLNWMEGIAMSLARTGAFLAPHHHTPGEIEALSSWNAASFVDLVRERNPLLLTVPNRSSYLRDPDFARRVQEGREREGSSTGALTGASVMWFQAGQDLQIHVRSDQIETLKRAMHDRLRHARPLFLFGDQRPAVKKDGSEWALRQVNVALLPEAGPSRIEQYGELPVAVLRLDHDARAELVDVLASAPGSYRLRGLPGVRFVVASVERFADPHYPW